MHLIKLLMLIILVSCGSTDYESDVGFLPPYKAEVFEYPVMVNGHVCKDMIGKVGACTLITDNRKDTKITLISRPYRYSIKMTCSSNINFNHSTDIRENQDYEIVISKDSYGQEAQFICIGRIIPLDRNFISARFELRVRVQDGKYIKRSTSRYFEKEGKRYLSMGKHSRDLYIFEGGKWAHYNRRSVVRVGARGSRGFSESELMRFNYYNF